jgi:hypothetical protein
MTKSRQDLEWRIECRAHACAGVRRAALVVLAGEH